jgi:hypothetical protein
VASSSGSRSACAGSERLAAKLVRKHREEGSSAVTDADQRRWLLPGTPPGLIKEAKAAKPLKALTAKQVATLPRRHSGRALAALAGAVRHR